MAISHNGFIVGTSEDFLALQKAIAETDRLGKGQKEADRYQIVPVGGPQYLDDAAAKAKSPSFLSEELRRRLWEAPAQVPSSAATR